MGHRSVLFAMLCLVFAQNASAETIVGHEIEKYFYKDGQIRKYEGEFEDTYLLDIDKNTLTRTRVYDYRKRKITPDETVYQIENTLRSSPTNAARYGLAPLIRAVGRPDKDSVQTVMIDDDFITTSTAAPGTFILARSKRLK